MATPTFTALATVRLVTNVNNITFSSIPNTYKSLVLYWDGPGGSGWFNTELNGDTTASNYDYVALDAAGTNFIGGSGNTNRIAYNVDNSGSICLRFNNYSSSTQYKHTLSTYSAQGQFVGNLASIWKNTNAITSITLTGPILRTDSKFSLFGVE